MDLLITAISNILSFPLKIYDWIKDKLRLDIASKGPVLITGCDSGFGHLLALKLVRNGVPTIAGCLTEFGENELKRKIGNAPGALWTIRLDVTDQSSVDNSLAFVKRSLRPGKGLWGLVNNAGIAGVTAPDDWLNIDAYKQAMEINFFGIVRVTQAFKSLIKLERGRIVVTTSIFGRVAANHAGPYCSSKYAAEAYGDVIRRELKPFGVSVHIIEPGFFATNITRPQSINKSMSDQWHKLPQHVKDEYGEEYLNQSSTKLEQNLPPLCSSKLDLVVDAYYDALTSCCPANRYWVGLDAKLFYIPITFVPTWIQDWVFEMLLKLNGAPKPRAAVKLGAKSGYSTPPGLDNPPSVHQ